MDQQQISPPTDTTCKTHTEPEEQKQQCHSALPISTSSTSTNLPSSNTQIQVDCKLCDNCEYNVIALYCTECKLSLCQSCDNEWYVKLYTVLHLITLYYRAFCNHILIKLLYMIYYHLLHRHLPARKRCHTRRARFDTVITDALIRAEREGSVSEYCCNSSDRSDSNNIKKYKYEADDGDWHVFKNGSKTLHLDSEITLELNNMLVTGYTSKNKLKLSLPPQSVQYLFIQCVNPDLEFSCELTQRFSIKPARIGALPSITDANLYTSSTPPHILQQHTKQYGTVSDYSATDPMGADIFQYYLVCHIL